MQVIKYFPEPGASVGGLIIISELIERFPWQKIPEVGLTGVDRGAPSVMACPLLPRPRARMIRSESSGSPAGEHGVSNKVKEEKMQTAQIHMNMPKTIYLQTKVYSTLSVHLNPCCRRS